MSEDCQEGKKQHKTKQALRQVISQLLVASYTAGTWLACMAIKFSRLCYLGSNQQENHDYIALEVPDIEFFPCSRIILDQLSIEDYNHLLTHRISIPDEEMAGCPTRTTDSDNHNRVKYKGLTDQVALETLWDLGRIGIGLLASQGANLIIPLRRLSPATPAFIEHCKSLLQQSKSFTNLKSLSSNNKRSAEDFSPDTDSQLAKRPCVKTDISGQEDVKVNSAMKPESSPTRMRHIPHRHDSNTTPNVDFTGSSPHGDVINCEVDKLFLKSVHVPILLVTPAQMSELIELRAISPFFNGSI
ncbi:uncharacterized protein L201_003070 [Kwoniella dendrophila CBS 6074]|uniref:Uncharacterized protein n=1 Tax=Kwoniella dendrophila CBS 6074 TaxID=1295534 RepID=A0AAX4JRY5_9TREE